MLASLRHDDWRVPAAVERLAGVIGLARQADESVERGRRARAPAGRRVRADDGDRAASASAARPMPPPALPRPVRATCRGRPAAPGGPETPPGLPLDRDKLLAARLHAVKVRPYLAGALFALHVVEDRSVPTMAVDAHWRCYVSPGFVARTPMEDLAGVWVHEVSHLIRDHHGRSERYARENGEYGPGERLRRNIAADFEINDDIYGHGLPVPAGAVGPSLLRLPAGLLMEEYLRTASMSGAAADLAWLDCGSGADGQARPWELGQGGAHGLSRQQRDAVRFRVAEAIKGRPGRRARGVAPLGGRGRSTRRSRGAGSWERRSAPRHPRRAWARTTAIGVPPGGRPDSPECCCRACAVPHRGSVS
ncbi:hypothetical protein GCM10017687_44280 [Streptomyces echinatus]